MRSMVHLAKLDSTDAMKHFSRRSFLASAGAVAAGPALGAPRPSPTVEVPRSGWVDAVIIGAGAAGIAAARRLTAAGKRYVLIEAAEEVGGRCITDTKIFGVPYDRGAHALYAGDINPMTKLAVAAGFDLYRAPPGQRIRIGKRYAREGEMEDFLAGLVRANSAIADAARKSDVACSQVLPKDLGEWRPTIEFVLGPYTCGKELSEVSTVDLARSGEHDNGSFCRQGLGALLTRLAAGLPILLGSPVKTIESWSKLRLEVDSAKGQFRTGAIIVTVSTNVLTSGKIKFAPDLPKRHLDAANKLKLGSHDHVALELTGNPLGLRADELVFEQSASRQTAAIFANMGGSTICVVDVGGTFGRELSAKGEAAMVDFAATWLAGLYGADIKNSVKRRHATRWNNEPWVLGAWSAAAPGAQPARKILTEPVSGRIFFAGEATHESLWGTVNGAWESGERAADAVLKLIGRR
jgi:monoamine oxidase